MIYDENKPNGDKSRLLNTKHLFDDELYSKLTNAQRLIKDETDIIPSLRKLIHEIIDDEAIAKVTQRLIKQYKSD